MIRRPWASIIAALAISAVPPAFGQQGSKKLIEVTDTQTVPFAAGGTIHFDHSFGELSIEGWDRPEVELTVTKSLNDLYDAKEQAEANKRLDTVHVSANRVSDAELNIVTTTPHYSRFTHPFGSTGGVSLNYHVRVPRNVKLAVVHGDGDVEVTGVVSDIDISSHVGDIVLLLPETGKYAFDAKSKIGQVLSDFDGDSHRKGLAGEQYSSTEASPTHRIMLRIGVGTINIKSSPPAAQPPAQSDLLPTGN